MSAKRRIKGMQGAQKGAQQRRAAVYRRAAEYLDGRYAEWTRGMCYAVVSTARLSDDPLRMTDDLEVFHPGPDAAGRAYWGAMWGYDGGRNWEGAAERAKECRVLALCFAAAMAEAGDL